MKRFYLWIVASAFLLIPLCAFTQVVETTECSAKIALGGANVSVSDVRIFQDTVIFEEYFEKFQSSQQITFGNTACIVPIPASFTTYPGCRARGIESIAGRLRFSLNNNSVFESPELDIPEGSVLKLRIKAGTKKCEFVINGTDIVSVLGGREKYETFNLISGIQRISIGCSKESGFVDSIRVISPITYLAEQNYEIEDDTLKIDGLKPATAYHVEIEAEQNGVSQNYFLKTENSFANPSAQIEDSSSVNLAWQKTTCNQGKTLHLYKVEDSLDDLLFGRIVYRSTGTNFSFEVFNGTGKDICLSDYEIGLFNLGNVGAFSTNWYTFSRKDTIKKDSYMMFCNNQEELSGYNYPVYPLKGGSSIQGGNEAIILLKKDVSGNYKDTIDLFGRLASSLDFPTYKDTILTRKATIRHGVKHNPHSTVPNFNSPLSEWNAVTYSATRLNSDTTFHRLDTPIAYTFVRYVDLTNHLGGVLLDSLDTRSKYLCIITQGSDTIASFGFATGKIIQSIGSGSWNDSSVWDCGQVPESVDKVIIGQGHRIVVNQDSTANCAQLVLQSDYSTAQADSLKADLQVLGVLNAEMFSVEASFEGYTQDTNGWHLFALPIAAESKTRDEIGRMFDRGEDDDLYYLDEQRYAWIPYAPNEQDEHFFTNRNGYLVAYDTNKTLLFSGDMFPLERVTLLDNASFTSESGNGYHLLCNPYSTSVGLDYFEQEGMEGYWLLDPATGAYTASDNNQPEDFRIPAFGGFIAKVACAENSLVFNPQPILLAKSVKAQDKVEHLHFGLQTSGGEDELRIYFRQDATWQYDKFDTYKRYSIGSAPDLSCQIGEMSLSVVGLPQFEDTLHLEVELLSKQSEDAVLRLKECDEVFGHIGLYDKISGALLCDFASDSLYLVDMSAANKPQSFDLVLVKRAESLSEGDFDNIKYSQSGREISILSPEKVDEVVVSDMQGRVIEKTTCKNIVLPYAGCFVMSVKSGTEYRFVKIMAL